MWPPGPRLGARVASPSSPPSSSAGRLRRSSQNSSSVLAAATPVELELLDRIDDLETAVAEAEAELDLARETAPGTLAETEAMIARARTRFGVDLMKTCHHGASDVTDEFLEATAPAAYVVSSGDEEGHVHPRPDLLGLLV